jgi:tetratricopeptide (TPR) repeat protein
MGQKMHSESARHLTGDPGWPGVVLRHASGSLRWSPIVRAVACAGIMGSVLAVPSLLADNPPQEEPSTPEANNRALREEQLDVARRLVKAFPDSANAIYLMGLVYREQGHAAEASECWEKCLKLNPKRADVYDSLGYATLLKGDYEKAAALFRKALEIDPATIGVHYHLAQALVRQGKIGEAVAVLQRDIEIRPRASRSHSLLAEAYLQLKEHEKAKNSYEAVIEIEPDFANAYYGLATVCARLGQKEKARQHRNKFKEIDSKKQKVGRDLRMQYGAEEALVVTSQSVAHTHTDVGRVYHFHEYIWRAEKLWRRAAALDPKNIACRFKLASLYQQNGKQLEALELCQQIGEVAPENPLNQLQMGFLNQRLGRIDAAEKAFRKVIAIAPRRAGGYHALAQLYLHRNRNLPEAKALAEKAVELEPVAPNYFLLSHARDKNVDLVGSLLALEQAIKLDPDNAEYRRVYGLLKKRSSDGDSGSR